MISSLVLILALSYASGQNNLVVDTRARVQHHTEYYTKLIQELVYELEKRGFCNLKLNDVIIEHNEQLYNFLVSGNATYTNGFLVSIEKIDVTNMEQRVTRDIVNGASVPTALVRGRLNLRDVKVGFDVDAHINDELRHYTGAFTHILVQYELNVHKNLVSGELHTSMRLLSLMPSATVRMDYMPSDSITEALSRRFVPSMNRNSAENWGTHFASILLEKAKTKIPFPNVCFNC
ncbi:uncharacterized protein LOC114251484 [Bombyx mandarina]|uniref:Uncharacterized protein LOC114251484 n=1 Tax=Bombyx mandarina TaxID=7092 RepID=A0A6J2KN52_BOMMA|nr:uncharacterized protein LOC114251484 [Bombyx mandarina]